MTGRVDCGRALLAGGVLAASAFAATGSDDEPETKKAPVPVALVEHVRLVAGGVEQSGWPLDPAADGGFALLGDDGVIVVVAAKSPPKIEEREEQPVTLLPSLSLVTGLRHPEEGVRDRCQELLKLQGDAALPFLGAALEDGSAEARRRALSILVERSSKKWTGRIRLCLADVDERVRQIALRAYVALAAEDRLERCLDALAGDDSVLVRHEAIVLLGRSGDVQMVDPLFANLTGCDERSLRLVTFDALRRLTGKNFGRDEQQWRNWWANHRLEFFPQDAR